MKGLENRVDDSERASGALSSTATGPDEETGDYPEFVSPPVWAPIWLPIAFLNSKTDNTYLVRVEAVPSSGAIGKGWIAKAYFANDEQKWIDESNKPIERAGVWQITAFAPWPEIDDIVVGHSSSCATSCTPAYPAGPCDCGADIGSIFTAVEANIPVGGALHV